MGVYNLTESQYRDLLSGLGPNYSGLGYAMAHFSLAGTYGQSYIVSGATEEERNRRAHQALRNNGSGALASVRSYRDGVEVTTDDPAIAARLRAMGIQPAERSRESRAVESLFRGAEQRGAIGALFAASQQHGVTDAERLGRGLRSGLPEITPEMQRRLESAVMTMMEGGLTQGGYRLTPEQYRTLMERLESDGYSTRLRGPYSPITGQEEEIRRGGQECGRVNVRYNEFSRQPASIEISTSDPRIQQELSSMGVSQQTTAPAAETERQPTTALVREQSYQLTAQQYTELMRRLGREGYGSSTESTPSRDTRQDVLRKNGEDRARVSIHHNEFTRRPISVTISTSDPRIQGELRNMGIERLPEIASISPAEQQPTSVSRR